MTLKDLRKSKGLNQAECAKYLGMTTRNYQNYENNPIDGTLCHNHRHPSQGSKRHDRQVHHRQAACRAL